MKCTYKDIRIKSELMCSIPNCFALASNMISNRVAITLPNGKYEYIPGRTRMYCTKHYQEITK